MTSAEIRQSFLDFFKARGHAIVPSSSLMPDSPNLLFTNAGMNQFVPIFLGQVKCPYAPGRAADTQKCIRAGGKHNDLEDVGLDTYHHTFFEMLGNWSFGDYFKEEAIAWAWELLTKVWRFPQSRLYATVYRPDHSKGDPSFMDEQAYRIWKEIFQREGLDPKVHIVFGGKNDNFWMMGDTGPCGPCSEIHVDLTPTGLTEGKLVNAGSPECIEIWNLVFIQYSANQDGTLTLLPAKHVDTGMGFERVTGIIQNTRGFTDFTRTISNYETDIFRPLFNKLEKLSGKEYHSTLPGTSNTQHPTSNIQADIAFRVIADHIRTLSFAIADGITPGNTDRNYVLRRILRRAVRYGRTLGFHEPFFYKLVAVLADTMGHVFPELRAKQDHIEQVIQREEEAFNRTLDKGIELFDDALSSQEMWVAFLPQVKRFHQSIRGISDVREVAQNRFGAIFREVEGLDDKARKLKVSEAFPHGLDLQARISALSAVVKHLVECPPSEFNKGLEGLDRVLSLMQGNTDSIEQLRIEELSGDTAFKLYDTYGFPLDLTEVMARERGLTVDVAGFNKLMEEQKARARAAQKKQVIELSQVETTTPTCFVGYDKLEAPATVLEVVAVKDKTAVILDASPFYAEMGGQVGDTGELEHGSQLWQVANTQKAGDAYLHFLAGDLQPTTHNTEQPDAPPIGSSVTVAVDQARRFAIQRHHTVTHLLHWALHEVVSPDATQKGSYVGPEKLTFDFSSAPLTPQQVADVERLVNERILENAPVTWTEAKYGDIKSRKDIMQFFGEKYGDVVRVVQIGGKPAALDGYSMELCGGTHTRATGEIGLFRIAAESAIAAGIRRIEAVSGLEAYRQANEQLQLIKSVAGKVNSPITELKKKIEAMLAQQKDLEKQLKAVQQKQAADIARGLAAKAQTIGSTPAIIENLGAADGDSLQSVADGLKAQFKGVVVLGGTANNAVALVATVSPDLTKKFQAGKIIQAIAPVVGGKGGGRPDNARGGGKDVSKLDEALARARTLLG